MISLCFREPVTGSEALQGLLAWREGYTSFRRERAAGRSWCWAIQMCGPHKCPSAMPIQLLTNRLQAVGVACSPIISNNPAGIQLYWPTIVIFCWMSLLAVTSRWVRCAQPLLDDWPPNRTDWWRRCSEFSAQAGYYYTGTFVIAKVGESPWVNLGIIAAGNPSTKIKTNWSMMTSDG